MSIKFLSLEKAFVSILLFLFPILLLTVKGGMNTIFFLLLILALLNFAFGQVPSIKPLGVSLAWLFVAFISPLLAVFFSQVGHQQFSFAAYDSVSRLIFSIPILLYLRKFDIRNLAIFQYSVTLGLLAALFAIYLLPSHAAQGNLASTYFVNHIHLGDLALALGILAALSSNWQGKDHWGVLLLKIIGIGLALFISARSGARGGWLSLPVVLLIWYSFHHKKRFSIGLTGFFISLAVATSLGAYWGVDMIHNRIDAIASDLASFSQGNKDTSIGIRFQLWQAALKLFIENPFYGVGYDGFYFSAIHLKDLGIISQEAAYLASAEVHNEILGHAVRFGTLGLVSILLVYLVPLIIFLHCSRTTKPELRTASIIGISLISAFFIFGLTVEIFNLKMTIAFFSLMLAILLAIATHPSSVKES